MVLVLVSRNYRQQQHHALYLQNGFSLLCDCTLIIDFVLYLSITVVANVSLFLVGHFSFFLFKFFFGGREGVDYANSRLLFSLYQ